MIGLMFFQIDPFAEFFLKIAHALHGKAKKLLYRSPLAGDMVYLTMKLSALSSQP